MELACIGLNYSTAPIELREKVAVSKADLGLRSKALLDVPGVRESVVLSSCNRTEYYMAADVAE